MVGKWTTFKTPSASLAGPGACSRPPLSRVPGARGPAVTPLRFSGTTHGTPLLLAYCVCSLQGAFLAARARDQRAEAALRAKATRSSLVRLLA